MLLVAKFKSCGSTNMRKVDYVKHVLSGQNILSENWGKYQILKDAIAILCIYPYLNNIFRGRIEYELIYRSHLVNYSVHIR